VSSTVVAIAPVLLLLLTLVLMDSFKLVRPRAVAAAIAWGAAAAVAAAFIYALILQRLPIAEGIVNRYLSPVTEETLKGIGVVYLIVRRRVGFPVDAAVLGFAIGAGFATVENLQYLATLEGASILLWVVRGLGTAVLHGATTSVAAMLAKTAVDRHRSSALLVFGPAAAAAIGIHSAFNHLLLPPVAMTGLLLLVLPPLLIVVFERSERATADWIGAGLDLDLEMLQLVTSEMFRHTRLGTYLEELRKRFPGPIVVDMFCLLRVELELSIQAKAVMMLRKEGLDAPIHPDTRRGLEELSALERSIGKTGLLALGPLHVCTHRDDWHRYLLSARSSR
jgi:RsiW-degrading membrane proteinase PrsW (M82 family)